MPCTRQRHPVGGWRYIARVRIGYGRVSTRDQHPDAQHDGPKVVEPGRDRDPMARHADRETASISIELDFGSYRHAQEVTGCMSIETVDTRASAAAAVALVRQRGPETRFLPIAARPVPDHPGISR